MEILATRKCTPTSIKFLKGFLLAKRPFSSEGNILQRGWRLVESRRVAERPVYRVGDDRPIYIPREALKYPDYPYGDPTVFKQSSRGLYGGAVKQFGNRISESKHKIRRTWMPNIIRKSLWSEALNRLVRMRLTAKVYRTISKEGGLDRYLLKDKPARVKELGPFGWRLRYDVLKALEKGAPVEKAAVPSVPQFEGEIGGKQVSVHCTRGKLLHLLYPLERLEQESLGNQTFTRRKFREMYYKFDVKQVLEKLNEYEYDLNSLHGGAAE
ncbi:mitochondrial 54S ribosomal protein bL28m KNAG_0F01610 [Huiozyma naganishii CBS 8797]|uniref:Large ribosomal subunit protein bL28m n=1 Tax=Huiozyma naganishii (strain ATCC MYA-139 / BCRC 22969 / CBS 8797 / KCTC 17520 / NBRC 10181 / NCYC 3082 / Yp74L-3) TaxID=1071383 RepID=J7S783_HUIN7|nr:hypothetical protein KNAG_0F01610 [Kazachstania naganishii CBS 8797]CCK70829.1 hypothetical protein KNAG_0F01610 [Kazachstania naganishii CBS 8797]